MIDSSVLITKQRVLAYKKSTLYMYPIIITCSLTTSKGSSYRIADAIDLMDLICHATDTYDMQMQHGPLMISETLI
jgi:formyltetrahydrofolate synthetase